MIAVRVMGPMRVAVVGAPAYFARQRPPRTPDDLALHSCVQYRRAADGAMFEWPFERGGKSEPISVDGRIIVNDTDLAVRAAVDGLGIAYTIEAVADPFLRSGHTGSQFHTKAWSSFAPPTCRMPLGQYQGIPRADPGGRVTPRF
jgi:DNA-binding transcriptional LysR family regulator